MRALLVGPTSRSVGEAVYVRTLAANPPEGWSYQLSGEFHRGAPGARCNVASEVLLNRAVRRATFPDMGMRSLSIRDAFDLVHVHAHPAVLHGTGTMPVVMS